MGEIVFEHLLHLRGECAVDDQRGHFEVESERTIVEVRCADRGKLIVSNDVIPLNYTR